MHDLTQCDTSVRDDDRYRYVRFLSQTEPALRRPEGARVQPVGGTQASDDSRPAAAAEDWQAGEAGEFLSGVLLCAGVDPDCYRGAPLLRRLPSCLRALRVRSVADARQLLAREPQWLNCAIGALLIGVTQFFRDAAVFDYLAESVLPHLTVHDRGVRIWSLGCADGAELYSVAMLLARQGLLDRSELVGIDCRGEAIRQARQGWFAAARVEGVSPADWRTFLVTERGGVRICEPMRQAIHWRQSDVLTAPLPGSPALDLVLCRNLAIYLQPAATSCLWRRLTSALRVGGTLVVGRAERPDQDLGLRRLASCVFEKWR